MTARACKSLVVVATPMRCGVADAHVARSQFNGTVTESAGGMLVGATVIATNIETNGRSNTPRSVLVENP